MINSVIKAIKILNCFSAEEPKLSLAEISRRLDMPKSTVHNLLNTMLSEGFIERADRDTYALGTAIIRLSQSVRVNVELRDRAAPLLRELADKTDESVYLTVLDSGHALYIYAIESSKRLLARSAVGDRAHLHCTSVGKAMMAFLAEDEVQGIVEQSDLPAFTEHTITDHEALYKDLRQTRHRGYAIDNQEHELHTYCIGAPILDAYGQVIGACSISGNESAILDSRIDDLAHSVMYTAENISRRMGFVPSSLSLINRRG